MHIKEHTNQQIYLLQKNLKSEWVEREQGRQMQNVQRFQKTSGK